ncbi:MAG: DUF2889 domain-containing protein [Candidatus Latescibacterota bacterium]
MPLPESAPREQLHTRQIECRGYRRVDGLWDIEGTLTDTKTFEFSSHARDDVKPGQPVHQISIRLTIDNDLVIQNAVGCMDYTPYPVCGNAAFMVSELEGLKIRPNWTRRAHKLMGGRRGCTHLFELLRPIATTCFQTMSGSRFRGDREYQTEQGKVAKRPFFIDSCHALAADGDIVKTFWPEFYEG